MWVPCCCQVTLAVDGTESRVRAMSPVSSHGPLQPKYARKGKFMLGGSRGWGPVGMGWGDTECHQRGARSERQWLPMLSGPAGPPGKKPGTQGAKPGCYGLHMARTQPLQGVLPRGQAGEGTGYSALPGRKLEEAGGAGKVRQGIPRAGDALLVGAAGVGSGLTSERGWRDSPAA